MKAQPYQTNNSHFNLRHEIDNPFIPVSPFPFTNSKKFHQEVDSLKIRFFKIPLPHVDGRYKMSQLWSFKSEPLWAWRCWEKDL